MDNSRRRFLENSNTVSLAVNFMRRYRQAEDRVDNIYADSLTCKIIRGAYERAKKYFYFSFINKITDVEEKNEITVIDESKVIKSVVWAAKTWSNSFIASVIKAAGKILK